MLIKNDKEKHEFNLVRLLKGFAVRFYGISADFQNYPISYSLNFFYSVWYI